MTDKKTVEFKNTKTHGDMIDALVNYFTGAAISDFVLTQAAEKVRANNEKIEAYTESLLKKEGE